jgi:hypothetical protein
MLGAAGSWKLRGQDWNLRSPAHEAGVLPSYTTPLYVLAAFSRMPATFGAYCWVRPQASKSGLARTKTRSIVPARASLSTGSYVRPVFTPHDNTNQPLRHTELGCEMDLQFTFRVAAANDIYLIRC